MERTRDRTITLKNITHQTSVGLNEKFCDVEELHCLEHWI
jgi:hypothetical protein